MVKSLPSRTYRDSAEVAMALGELKSGKATRDAKQVESTDQPSKKGGRTAATSSISAAAIARIMQKRIFLKSMPAIQMKY